jgi:hypothetical protein
MPSHLVRQFAELRAALAARGESARAFGLRNRIDKSTLNRLLNGNITQFGLGLMDKVVAGTDGAVSHETFAIFARRLAEHPLPARKRKRKRAA